MQTIPLSRCSAQKEIIMKKLIVVLLVAVVLATAISVGAFELGLVKSEDDRTTTLYYVEPEDGSTPYFVKKYDDGTIADTPITVISFSDTHLGDGSEPSDIISLTIIDRIIKQKHPDLVVITGDVCLGSTPYPGVDALAKVFEDNKTYWAVVLGNHDAEPWDGPTREELIRYYENKPYSLTKEGPDLDSEGNYMINVMHSTGVSHTLVFMDSGAGHVDLDICKKYGIPYSTGYDFIKPDQQKWYVDTLNDIKGKNNGVLPESTMFMHIPFVEYHYVDLESRLYGFFGEPSCPSDYNSGMFDLIKEFGSTKTVVCGHDHVNNFAVMYEGIKLMYSQSSSFGSYHSRNQFGFLLYRQVDPSILYTDGHTEFTISADGSCVDTPFFNELHPEVFEGLEDELIANGTPLPPELKKD